MSWVAIGALEKVGLEPAMLAGFLLDMLNSFAKYNLDMGRYNLFFSLCGAVVKSSNLYRWGTRFKSGFREVYSFH